MLSTRVSSLLVPLRPVSKDEEIGSGEVHQEALELGRIGAHRSDVVAETELDVDVLADQAPQEVDGAVHQYTAEQDAIRQEFLDSLGLRVIRFTNDDIWRNLDGVISILRREMSISD